MANEIIFNIDQNLEFPLSSYAFSSGSSGILYFRGFKNNYVKNWESTDSLSFIFKDKNDQNISYAYTLTQDNLVTIESEKLFKLELDTAMMSRNGVYSGQATYNNSSKYLDIDIVIFSSTIAEMGRLLQATRNYQNELKDYLYLAKKDMLDAPSGLAILDTGLKLKESYLPSNYREHINSSISKTEVHQVKIDENGIAWLLDGSAWVEWAGQPTQSVLSPPSVMVRDAVVTVTYDPKQVIALQKWATGNQNATYFRSNGTTFTGNTFKVTKSGIHTLYYRDGENKEYVQTFTVLDTDIPYPNPRIEVVNGVVAISHSQPEKVLLQKWGVGVLDTTFFQTQGTIVVDNRFVIATTGTFTLYYKLTDGREKVVSFVVDDSMLPQDKMPRIVPYDGAVTITYDSAMIVIDSKWDFGEKTVADFASSGFPIVNNKFDVYQTGKYTLYFKTDKNKEYVLTFNVDASQLKQTPSVTISILNGIATVVYPSSIQVILSKWEKGQRTIDYFANSGTPIVNNTFKVTDTGIHTLYFKTVDNKQYIQEFNVTVDQLPFNITPYYSITQGELNISVSNESVYTANRFTWQKVDAAYFENNGASNQVVNWRIPLTQKGWLTHYYATSSDSGVYSIEIKDADLLHTIATINIEDGLAKVTNVQPSGLTVDNQKWAVGDRDIVYFKTSGTPVINDKFYVVSTGIHTLYYKLSNGGEYVVKFTVNSSQLEQPVERPTITINLGKVTPTFNPTMNISLKKWGAGNLPVAYFQNSGTVFTNDFTVPSSGQYTIYIKMKNEKEYVFVFDVTEDDMKPTFITPAITTVQGKVTIDYDQSMNVTLSKWAYGNNTVEYFENNGAIIVDNTFNVTTAGQYTLYTVLSNQYKYLTLFSVTESQLPTVDPPPTIKTTNGTVTITLNPSIVATEQRWALGLEDKEFFQNGNGTLFTGNTFEVSVAGGYSYYYKNSYNQDYLFHFNVTEGELKYYDPIVTVFDALMTVEYTSPMATIESKIATGVQDLAYFETQGEPLMNGQYPISVADVYTLYWEQEDNRKFIKVFTVSQEQTVMHEKPSISVNDKEVTVVYDPSVESLVTEKKYDAGDKNVDWFISNGTVLTSNQFTVSSYGVFTYFYKYRNRGYIINFTVTDYSYLVPLSSIPNDGEVVFGGRLMTKVQSDATKTLLSDESHFVETSRFGADNTIDPSIGNTIGEKLSSTYFDRNNYRAEEYFAILISQWNNGTVENPSAKTYNARIGTVTSQEATERLNRMKSKGLINKYWTSTYQDDVNIYALNIETSSLELHSPSTVMDIRGQMWVENDVGVEKAPTVAIANGVVTITE